MAADRDRLRRFMLENATGDGARKAVPGLMAELEPLFLTAESGMYGSQARPLREGEAAAAVALALGSGPDETRAVAVRPEGLLPRQPWMTEGTHQQLLNGLGDSLGGSLGASLRASLWDSLRASLRDSLRDSLWASLRDSLWASLRLSLGASLGASLRDSLWASLFYRLGFALAGDREKAGRLAPLVRLLPSCVPLGQLKEGAAEPGAWLCLDFSPEPEPDPLYPAGRKPEFLKGPP